MIRQLELLGSWQPKRCCKVQPHDRFASWQVGGMGGDTQAAPRGPICMGDGNGLWARRNLTYLIYTGLDAPPFAEQ